MGSTMLSLHIEFPRLPATSTISYSSHSSHSLKLPILSTMVSTEGSIPPGIIVYGARTQSSLLYRQNFDKMDQGPGTLWITMPLYGIARLRHSRLSSPKPTKTIPHTTFLRGLAACREHLWVAWSILEKKAPLSRQSHTVMSKNRYLVSAASVHLVTIPEVPSFYGNYKSSLSSAQGIYCFSLTL